MSPTDQDAYRAAWANQEKLARSRRLEIHHVRWQDGRMDTIMEPRAKAAPAAPEPERSSRGIAQSLLI